MYDDIKIPTPKEAMVIAQKRREPVLKLLLERIVKLIETQYNGDTISITDKTITDNMYLLNLILKPKGWVIQSYSQYNQIYYDLKEYK